MIQCRPVFMLFWAALLAAPSQAAIVYSGSIITNACGNRTETSGVGLNQTNLGSVAPGLSCSSLAQNDAAPGQVRISAVSSVNGAAAYGESKTNSTAQFAIDDLFITGPGATASGVLRLNVDGILNLSTSVSGTQPSAYSYAYWGLRIDSTFDQGYTNRNERVFILNEDGEIRVDTPAEGSFGVLSGYQGGTRIVDLAFSNLPTNTNLNFFLTVTSEAQAVAGGCVEPGLCNSWTAGSGSTINFMNTVSLVEGQAAFVFDEAGFLANSASLNLQDNVWQGVVPLPGAAFLFSSGLLGLVFITRRKRTV
jgi:hypothetical protein